MKKSFYKYIFCLLILVINLGQAHAQTLTSKEYRAKFFEDVKNNKDKWTMENASNYIDTVKFIQRFEFAEPVKFKNAVKARQIKTSLFEFFVAHKSYADNDVSCLLGGRLGVLKDKRCKPADATFETDLKTCQDQGYDIPCSKDLFPGKPLTCANSSGNRWTAACAAQFFDSVGLKGKTIDSNFEKDDLKKLAFALNDKKILPSEVIKNTEKLCQAIKDSDKNQDIKDCESLTKNFKSLQSFDKKLDHVKTAVEKINNSTQFLSPKTLENKNAKCSSKKEDPQRKCSVDDLTHSCEDLKNDITFKDGSKISGWVDKPEPTLSDADATRLKDLNAKQKYMRSQMKNKLPALGSYIDSNPNDDFTYYLFKNNLQSKTLDLKASNPMNWPSGSATDYKKPTLKEAQKIMTEQLGSNFLIDYAAIVDEKKRISDQANNVETDSQIISRVNKTNPNKIENLKKYVEFAKKNLIDQIKSGRSDQKLTAVEKANIEKIKKIQYLPVDSDRSEISKKIDPALYDKGCNRPNAFYYGATNSFIICPNLLDNSDLVLIDVIGHEIGHSIDPKNFVYDSESKNMTSNNKIQYPFQKAKDCLFDHSQAHFDLQNTQVPKMNRAEYVDELVQDKTERESGLSQTDMTTFRKDAQNKVDRMTDDQFRLVATTKDESGEVMADYFGAKVLGDYIKINKINPNQEPHDNLKPLGLFITNYCKNNNKLKTQDSFSTEFKILSTHMNDGHPAEKKRIEYLLLSNPNIASYVGCEPIAPNLCR